MLAEESACGNAKDCQSFFFVQVTIIITDGNFDCKGFEPKSNIS